MPPTYKVFVLVEVTRRLTVLRVVFFGRARRVTRGVRPTVTSVCEGVLSTNVEERLRDDDQGNDTGLEVVGTTPTL